MINNALFFKAVADSCMTLAQISEKSCVSEEKIKSLMIDGDDVSAVEIQALSRVLGMSENMRRNIFFNRDLPLE